jgi:putative hemolysin
MLAITLLLAGLFALLLAACGEEAPVDAAATPLPTVDVPPVVNSVRDAAGSYLRESAAICAPPEGAVWHADKAAGSATPGSEVFRFVTGDCTLTVAGPDPLPADARFYVAYRNEASAFCWQALIDDRGEILATGYEHTIPGLENPAQTYCEAQGARFEVITREDGTLCGACVFADGSFCNAWAYLYGDCESTP